MSTYTSDNILGGGPNGSGVITEYEGIKHTFYQNLMQSIVPSDSASGDLFGISSCISIDGTTSVVGAQSASVSGVACGKVYIFKQSSNYWSQIASLSPTGSDLTISASFGSSVAISPDGNYIAVGASTAYNSLNIACGTVYIYKLTNSVWTFQQKVEALTSNNIPSGISGDRFGSRVSMSNNILMVGAYVAAVSIYNSAGKVCIYNKKVVGSSTITNWTQLTSMTADTPSAYTYFGSSVAISGNEMYCFIGCSGSDIVYIYYRSGTTWTQLAQITASNDSGSFGFGSSVACSFDGTYLVVGAIGGRNSVGPALSGSAYIFYYNGTTFVESDILVGSDRSVADDFGISVDVSADANYIAVGSMASTVSGVNNAGAVYLYKRLGTGSTNYSSNTFQMQKIVSSSPSVNAYFGFPVTLSGDGLYLNCGAYNPNGAGYSNVYKADNYFPLRTTSILNSSTTTGTITMNDWNNVLILGTLSGATTIVLPTNVIDGRIVNIIITNANGQTISFTPDIIGWTDGTTAAAYKTFRIMYNAGFTSTISIAPDNTWYVL